MVFMLVRLLCIMLLPESTLFISNLLWTMDLVIKCIKFYLYISCFIIEKVQS